jgi:hypothetical protein
MLSGMDSVLHRIEALPGSGRYAVTFVRPNGVEQTATVQVGGAGVDVAEASLPVGWTRDSEMFRATADAVAAVDSARRLTPAAAALSDIEGGWDVGLGNVVLGADGRPVCTAHGPMEPEAGNVFCCSECGAAAVLA